MAGKSAVAIDLSSIEPDMLYPAQQAGSLTNRTEKTLANLRSERRGPAFVKLGQSIFYRGSDLLADIERSRNDPNAPRRIVPRRGPPR